MDLIGLGCSLASLSPVEQALNELEKLGDGLLDLGIASTLAVAGILFRSSRLKRVGFAAFLAVLASALLANLLKVVFQVPRPFLPREGYGFPSGHASTAFALAGAVGYAFPAWAPWVSLCALLAGVARLFYRGHFVADVIGGILLGTGIGLLSARKALGPQGAEGRSRIRWLAWGVPGVVAVLTLGFFVAYERGLERYRPGEAARGDVSPRVAVAFGTPEARKFLGEGWSGDERWKGRFPVVKAGNSEAVLRLPALNRADHRIRLRMEPMVDHRGPTCLVMEMALDGAPLARVLVEKGWREYEIPLPRNLIRPGPHELRFRGAYADAPGSRSRVLWVSFASLEVFESTE